MDKKTLCRQCYKKCSSGFCTEKCRKAFNAARRLERAARKSKGLCAQCTKKAVAGKTLCERHAERWSAHSKVLWAKLKSAAFDGYGGPVCKCCGTTILAFLTIDHIDGGGYSHRRDNGLQGSALYRWLVKNNFPAGYRVLCFNCNSGRHINGGVCPCDGFSPQCSAV